MGMWLSVLKLYVSADAGKENGSHRFYSWFGHGLLLQRLVALVCMIIYAVNAL